MYATTAGHLRLGDRLLHHAPPRGLRHGFGPWLDGAPGVPIHKLEFSSKASTITATFASGDTLDMHTDDPVERKPWPTDLLCADDLTEYKVQCVRGVRGETDGEPEDLGWLRVLQPDRAEAKQAAERIFTAQLQPDKTEYIEARSVRRVQMDARIPTAMYAPVEDKPGYIRPRRTRSIQDVFADLTEALTERMEREPDAKDWDEGQSWYGESWCINHDITYAQPSHLIERKPELALKPTDPVPYPGEYEVSARQGGSEGHYVYVVLRLFDQPDDWPSRIMLYSGKYLGFGDNLNEAYRICAYVAQFLNGES